MARDTYFARLCWNSSRWVRPTGEAAHSEQGDTYNAAMGFGHEEWLFNYQWILDGWKYGFLQPVNRSLAKVAGETIDVRLYTISTDRTWFYVGEVRGCSVLTEEEARAARVEFKRRGWFKQMCTQLSAVGGDARGMNYERATLLFNVRFKPNDAVLYDPMVPVARRDGIRAYRRYTLVSATGERTRVDQEWTSRVAATQKRPTGKLMKGAVSAHEVDLAHNQLQNELFSLLASRYGKRAVKMEEGFVDLKIARPNHVALIEIKSDSRPRFAIREALGQLLEYAFIAEHTGQPATELVVVGPGQVTERDAQYVTYLREQRGLPIRYVCFRAGMTQVDL